MRVCRMVFVYIFIFFFSRRACEGEIPPLSTKELVDKGGASRLVNMCSHAAPIGDFHG